MPLVNAEKNFPTDFVLQSESPSRGTAPRHVAVIMDGNGRWATRRGLPRAAGHRAGARAVREVITAAPRLGVATLTLYAFSSDNWRRPASEVSSLLHLFERYLESELAECARRGVRLSVIGRRDRLPGSLVRRIDIAESRTRACSRLTVRLAVDYSGRQAILEAARRLRAGGGADEFGEALLRGIHSGGEVGDVDLLVRTGGECRLSDFLLWESAYAELYFTDCLWPDFDGAALERAVVDFRARDRRFGALPGEQTASAASS